MRLLGRLRRAVAAEGSVLLKLGIYTLACLLVLGWLISQVGNVKFFADRTTYQAELHDVTGNVRLGEDDRRRATSSHPRVRRLHRA